MSADAIAVFRPRERAKLEPFLDLDDESDESDGLYAEALDDGAILVHTFQPFEIFAGSPHEAQAWLAQFGDALPDVHDDPRGLLFFPDSCEPEATTYDAVVDEVGEQGVWILPGGEDFEAGGEDLFGEGGGLPPIDMQTLQAFAGQLLGGADGGEGPATPFDVAKLFEGVHGQLLDALGVRQAGEPPEVVDAEAPVAGGTTDEDGEAQVAGEATGEDDDAPRPPKG